MSTLSTELKSEIDRLWESFWTGGITNPLTVIEQISLLMFVRLLDVKETNGERRASRTKKEFHGHFDGPDDPRRWKNFKQQASDKMLATVRDQVVGHLRTLNGGTTFAEYMKDVQLMITNPRLLQGAVELIDALPITDGDAKGDLYEYLLSKLTTAGIAGQFRTPRHIIHMMVELTAPKPTETVADPSCGTAGFLVGVMQYLLETYSSDEGTLRDDQGGKPIYTGDLLEPYRSHIQDSMFHGFDFDATMLRIASMNLMLHGIDNPAIHNQDTLSNSFPERFRQESENGFDVILANPPFTGSLDLADVHPSLTRTVKTKKSELLFLALILRMLKPFGRSATVVPEGVLFGSSRAHKTLRQTLIEEHQLEAVISMPSGVFKPYAGVKTAVLVFCKGGETGDVWFYDMQRDGYSLDDKRDELPVDQNDIPDLLKRWADRDQEKVRKRTEQSFFVPREEIVGNGYDLSVNRYREVEHEAVACDPPKVILARLAELEAEIGKGREGLEELLG